MLSIFRNIEQAPTIEAAHLFEQCLADKCTDKVNLTLGVYRNFDGKPIIIPVVRKVEIQMATNIDSNKDYLPITGIPEFCDAGIRLLMGSEHPAVVNKLASGIQTIGGSGAVYLAAMFLKRVLNYSIVYISNPSWPSHRGICSSVGFEVREYRYWELSDQSLNFSGLIEDLLLAPINSVVILHPCAHNPTGMDLNQEQWMILANVMKKKRLFPLFDIAYQGFASGDLEDDAWVLRMFFDQGFEFLAAQSFSKNFGLYNERVGNLITVTNNSDSTKRAKSQFVILARYCWSNPANHGARIVSTVLNDPDLLREWKENLHEMSQRIIQTRQLFYEKLTALQTPGKWSNIIKQRGMFSYTGLTYEQTKYLRNTYHIYMTGDGRMNMCGLNKNNIDYVVNAIHETVMMRGAKGDE